MINKIFAFKLVFTFLMTFGLMVFAQAQEVEKLYKQTEQIYSTDDLLVNGQIYIPTRPRAKGSPYFGEKEFVKGSVQIKGREFKDVLLRYNLEDQRLILRVAIESGKIITIVLNSKLIDYFIIGGQRFIYVDSFLDDVEVSGFYVLVYKGSFAFLIKYEKSFRAVYDIQTPNGSYTDMKSDYFIFDGNKLIGVSKKKMLLNYFLPQKKEINSFMRKQKIQYKKASMISLNHLMKYCDSISTNK